MKCLFFVFLLLGSSLNVYSQEDKDLLCHYIGGAFGMSTGYGLSYRYWPGSLGAQVVFSPYWQNKEILLNLGFSGFKTLYESSSTRLFLYLAANGTYNYSDHNDEFEDGRDSDFKSTFGFTTGLGPGIELYIFRHVVFDAMFGYSYSVGDTFFELPGIGFTAEVAIYYRF